MMSWSRSSLSISARTTRSWWQRTMQSSHMIDLCSGRIDLKGFHRQMSETYQSDLSFDTFKELWCSIFYTMDGAEELTKELNGTVKLGLLSGHGRDTLELPQKPLAVAGNNPQSHVKLPGRSDETSPGNLPQKPRRILEPHPKNACSSTTWRPMSGAPSQSACRRSALNPMPVFALNSKSSESCKCSQVFFTFRKPPKQDTIRIKAGLK